MAAAAEAQRVTRSTCPYCGVGCGVLIASQGNRITGVQGDPDHPANRGRLCSKGSTLAHTAEATLAQHTRLLQPLHRPQRGAPTQPLGWNAALDLAAQRLADTVNRHGADAVGVYVSGQLLTEDYYVFNKLVKGLLGTNHIDTNSRLCMSSAVAGYKATLGADAPPACYDDVAHAHTLFIAGSNTAWAHPVLFRRVEDARAARPELKLIVVDPRRTDTAAQADLHLALQPGTDVALFHGLLHILLWEGWVDHAYIAAHTTGFDALKALVRDFTPDHVASTCGLNKADLFTAARWFAGVDGGTTRWPTLSLYCQGLNQSTSGTDKNTALINLHLATGQIGRPGAGPFSLTGQPNAMGGREVGGLANLLSAHRDLSNPTHRAEVEALWGLDRVGRQVPHQPGRTAVDLFQAAADGEVKALWIACTNPAQSLPDQNTVRRALERAEFVVVQEAFATTATTAYADLLLPATTWGEKDGTVTNSERCISRVRPAVQPPSVSPSATTTAAPTADPETAPRHDWLIATQVAQRLQALLRPHEPNLFPYDTPESVWNEHRESTRGRDLDITGLSYDLLERSGPQQWPLPEGQAPGWSGQARLYADGRFPTPDGKARFTAPAYRPVAEPRVARYPFALTTGRLRDQWHGMSRTGTIGRLFGHVPEPVLNMHPQDLSRRGLTEGQLVRVSSVRGGVVVPVQSSDQVGLGQLFMAMHWGSEVLGGQDAEGRPLNGVNALTTPATCPTSRQPEFKHAAVRIDKVDLPWTLVAMAWLPPEQAHTARRQLAERLHHHGYAVCVPFGREHTGVLFRAASAQPATAEELQWLENLLGLQAPDTLRYRDARNGQHRAVRFFPPNASGPSPEAAAERPLAAVLLAGDTRSAAWIQPLLQQRQPAGTLGRALLQATATSPTPSATAGRSAQVCACLNVSQDAITQRLATCTGDDGQRLQQLQAALACGTQCGSCVPTLKTLIRQTPIPPTPTGAPLAI